MATDIERRFFRGVPRKMWKCGNCIHWIEDTNPPPQIDPVGITHQTVYQWNCSKGNPTPEGAKRGPCMQYTPKPLTDNDY